MIVRLQVQFESPTEDDVSSLKSVALGLTNDAQSIRIVPREDDPRWLITEFKMPTEAQSKAVDKIDAKLRFSVWNRMDSIISFPKSVAEGVRAQRKAERRRAGAGKSRSQCFASTVLIASDALNLEQLGTKRKFWFSVGDRSLLFKAEERKERLETKDRNRTLSYFVQKARSAFYAKPSDAYALGTLEAFTKLAELSPEAAKAWLGRLALVGRSQVQQVLDDVPNKRMSSIAKQFTLELLDENKRRLTEGYRA